MATSVSHGGGCCAYRVAHERDHALVKDELLQQLSDELKIKLKEQHVAIEDVLVGIVGRLELGDEKVEGGVKEGKEEDNIEDTGLEEKEPLAIDSTITLYLAGNGLDMVHGSLVGLEAVRCR